MREKFLAVCGGIFLTLLFIPPLLLYYAWAFRLLWTWFVVPTFALAPLTYPQAMGLKLVHSAFVGVRRDPKEMESAGQHCLNVLICPLVLVFIGYVIRRIWGMA